MNFLFLFSLFNILIVNLNALQFSSIEFYSDNNCTNINLIIYSYENLEICENDIILNNCNVFSKLNESTKGVCGTDSLLDTKKKLKNNNYVYTNVFDTECNKTIGAITLILDKCINYMGTNYFKINKEKNNFITNYYTDKFCNNKNNNNNLDKLVDLDKCKEKNKIYTKDGLFKNKTDDNSNNIENNTNKMNISILILLFSFILTAF